MDVLPLGAGRLVNDDQTIRPTAATQLRVDPGRRSGLVASAGRAPIGRRRPCAEAPQGVSTVLIEL
jgi:hypothetical protein